jgi:hypothetical protein
MSHKRKHGELESDEEDEPAFGKQILPVANLPDDFNGEPMDGMQYLFTVRRVIHSRPPQGLRLTLICRRDARKLPSVTRVHNPFEGSGSDHVVASNDTFSASSASTILPSTEWREVLKQRFTNFRKVCSLNCIKTLMIELGGTAEYFTTNHPCQSSPEQKTHAVFQRTRPLVGFFVWAA